jgi:hypothetical protein
MAKRPALLQEALEALTRATGLEARALKKPGGGGEGPCDVEVEAHPPIRFTALVRDAARPEELGGLKALGGALRHPPLVVAPHVNPRAAQVARELDLAFIDAAGNAYLKGAGTLVFVTGRRRPPDERRTQAPRGATAGGLRVTFNLLTHPRLVDATYRDMAVAAGVALGTVGAAMEDLRRRGHIRETRRGRRELLAPERLAEEWILLYPVRLRPKLRPRRFAADDPRWWRRAQIDPERAALGGEAAAELLTGHLKATGVTLYARKPLDTLLLAHRLRPDEEGDVEVLDAFWPLGTAQVEGPAGLAPRLLVMADLLATGEARNVETARLIRGEVR